jgi:hypothetical protein
MSTAPKSTVNRQASTPGVPEREPNLMRFGLRQFFLFISLATLLIAAMATLGGVWPWVIGSLAALVAAHVLGTFLGTRLRDTSAEVQQWKARPGSPDRDEPVALPQPVSVADLNLPATTSLASYEKIGRWRNWLVAAATVIGFAAGGAGIHRAVGDDVTWPGVALGAVSCGVIGAWAALLGVNFYMIARHVLREANRESKSR